MRRLDRRTGRGRARTASPLEVQLPAGVSRSIRGRRKVVSSGRAVQAHGPIRDGVLHQVPGRTSRLVKHAEASATCAAAWALPRRRASQVHNPWCGGILAEVNVLEVGVRRLRHRGDCSACCVGKAFGQRQRLAGAAESLAGAARSAACALEMARWAPAVARPRLAAAAMARSAEGMAFSFVVWSAG